MQAFRPAAQRSARAATIVVVRAFTSALAILLLCGGTSGAQSSRSPDTIYLPTPAEVVTAMLRMANVGRGDVVYDLGSGDGRIVIAAVKEFGAVRGVGVELDPTRVQEANENARRAGVKDRVEFRQQDVLETDIRAATVVALYMGQTMNLKLRPKLMTELKAGSRVVSHAFDMGDWMPVETRLVNGRPVFLWMIER